MRYAIVSDIHANWQAWQAVKDDIRARQADALFCLGDVIGYGPRPAEVLADVRKHCDEILMGNHEAAASGLMDDEVFTDESRASLAWTRKKLGGEQVRWCRHLPYEVMGDDVVFAHAETPAPREFGYVEETEDAAACFECNCADFIFLGHTHVPALFLKTQDGNIVRTKGTTFQPAPGARVIVNVGSVGIPRDGTSDASYCLFEPERRFITFCRVSFDCEALRRDIEASGSGWVPYFMRKEGAADERHAMKAVKVASHHMRRRARR